MEQVAVAEEEKELPALYNILPPVIRRKIRALKKLQYKVAELEAKYFHEVHKLECKYMQMHDRLFGLRSSIVQGKVEPSDEDCDFKDGYESPDEADPTLQDLRRRLAEARNLNEEVAGVPEFWLTVMKNAGRTFDLVQPHDEIILKYLKDIKVNLSSEPMGFSIAFKFANNPYFTNRILTKTYEMKCALDPSSPWSFDGPEIVRARGTEIDWKKGMNVTLKPAGMRLQTKRSVSGSEGNLKQETFFSFFSPPDASACTGDRCEEVQRALAEDYAIGIFFREKLVPNAVLYLTGDVVEDDTESSELESTSCDEFDMSGSEGECKIIDAEEVEGEEDDESTTKVSQDTNVTPNSKTKDNSGRTSKESAIMQKKT